MDWTCRDGTMTEYNGREVEWVGRVIEVLEEIDTKVTS